MTAPTTDYAEQVSGLVPICRLTPAARGPGRRHRGSAALPAGAFVFREGDRDGYAYYLLEGNKLELVSGGQTVQRIVGGAPDAACALASYSRARCRRAPKPTQRCCGWRATCSIAWPPRRRPVTAWISRSTRSKRRYRRLDDAPVALPLFARLPAANIHRVFTRLETHPVEQGAVVVRQGDPGDFYYVIVSGRAEVSPRCRAQCAELPARPDRRRRCLR